jgi:hypothetical protein
MTLPPAPSPEELERRAAALGRVLARVLEHYPTVFDLGHSSGGPAEVHVTRGGVSNPTLDVIADPRRSRQRNSAALIAKKLEHAIAELRGAERIHRRRARSASPRPASLGVILQASFGRPFDVRRWCLTGAFTRERLSTV